MGPKKKKGDKKGKAGELGGLALTTSSLHGVQFFFGSGSSVTVSESWARGELCAGCQTRMKLSSSALELFLGVGERLVH